VGCIFCAIAKGELPSFGVLDTPEVIAFLDVRPLFVGHVLVIPRAHVGTLPELPDETLAPFFRSVRLLSAAVPAALGAEGSFVAMNNIVSQSVPHLHAHVVPRKKKDGLKGFFWPRTKYENDEHSEQIAALIRAQL